eukprot:TRINITY_DN2980_c0_g2_i1.p1 TRINITY_DN2980_c0_g2~~TRINITY_DN2980_c0_g2_i1.p1  ORF type:complete len:913 (+),score=140.87 TRINITY_DN2980_c0_g2_i1:329-2740(+)
MAEDGRCAIGSWDTNVYIWNMTDNVACLRGHGSSVQALQWTTPTVLWSIDMDSNVHTWEAGTDSLFIDAMLSQQRVSDSQPLSMDVNGDYVVVTSKSGQAVLFHRELGHQEEFILDGMLGHPRSLATSTKDLDLLVMGHYSGAVSIRRTNKIKQAVYFDAHDSAVCHVALAAAGRDTDSWLLTADDHAPCIRVWRQSLCEDRFEQGETIEYTHDITTGDVVSALDCIPTGRGSRVVYATRCNELRLGSVDSRTGEVTVLWKPRNSVLITGLKMRAAEQFYAVGQDGSISLMSGTHKSTLKVLQAQAPNQLNCVDVATKNLVVASNDHSLQLWRQERGEWSQRYVLQGHEGAVLKCCFDRHGTRVISTSMDGTARVWAVESGQLLTTWRHGPEPVHSACFVRETAYVATNRELQCYSKLQPDVAMAIGNQGPDNSTHCNQPCFAVLVQRAPTSTGSSRCSATSSAVVTNLITASSDHGLVRAELGAAQTKSDSPMMALDEHEGLELRWRDSIYYIAKAQDEQGSNEVKMGSNFDFAMLTDGRRIVGVTLSVDQEHKAKISMQQIASSALDVVEASEDHLLTFQPCYAGVVDQARQVVLFGGLHGQLMALHVTLNRLYECFYEHSSSVVGAACVNSGLMCLAYQDGHVAFLTFEGEEHNAVWCEMADNHAAGCGLRNDWATGIAAVADHHVVMGTRAGRLVMFEHANGFGITQVADVPAHQGSVDMMQVDRTGCLWTLSQKDQYIRCWRWQAGDDKTDAGHLKLVNQHRIRQVVVSMYARGDRGCGVKLGMTNGEVFVITVDGKK